MTRHSPSPRLRRDLIASRQQAAGATLCILKDPASGAFFRLGELEHFIANQLDGATPLDTVRKKTEERFGAALPPEAFTAFIDSLRRSGLLETDGAPQPEARRRRMRGSVLYLRFPLFDPDRLFTRLVRHVGFCFTPAFLVLSGTLILLAAGTTVANWSEIAQALVGLLRPSLIPTFLAVSFAVASAHEFAHGLTCKRFGGEVHELGFLLIYFTPALYTNVSDAWLFPQKSRRLWVGFAGPYFELLLWAVATVVWRVTEVEVGVHGLALMVMAVSGLKTLGNFNPFIKLDGYYLLSDYLEIPNLRRKAFRYVGDSAKRLVGLGRSAPEDVSPRERRVYLAYGLVATVVSVTLLGYVLVTTGGVFLENHQPLALVFLTSLVGLRSRRRIGKLLGGAAQSADPSDDGDDTVAAETPEKQEKTKKKKRRPPRPLVWWVAAGAAALVLVFLVRMELRIGGSFTVLPEENADVRAPIEGIVEAVLVDEGQEVSAGDVVVRLSDEELLPELRKTEAAIRENRAALQKLEAGPSAEEVALARAAVSRVEDRLGFAQTRAARLEQLYAASVVTRQELESAQELATTAENDLAEARGRLTALLRRTRPEDIAGMRARIEQQEAQLRHFEQHRRLLDIVSPVSGIVATPSRQLKALHGQLVGRGALVAKVYDFSTVAAQIVVSEKEIADVRVGQRVVVKARAFPSAAFEGHVTAVATAAEGTSVAAADARAPGVTPGGGDIPSQKFIVTTRIANRSLLLKPGMTGYGKIFGGPRRIIDLITRRLARTFRVEFWSWW